MASNRREFLSRSIGGAGLIWLRPTAIPALLAQTAAAATQASGDTILVALQLSGGNDGLNTVVPYEDAHYHRSRPTLRLTDKEVLKIDAGLGFHPQMAGLHRLYNDGRLGIVQGVGYPNVNENHETSMEIWQTARLGAPRETGWLGRTIDRLDRPDEPGMPGVFVGQTRRPLTLNAQRAVVPILRTVDDCTLQGEARGLVGRALPAATARDTACDSVGDAHPTGDISDADRRPLLEFMHREAARARAASAKVEEVVKKDNGLGGYPPLALAQNLRTIAQLIRADLGTRIYVAELGGDGFGGFDNHANQAPNHAALLHHLSESLAAFADDLGRAGLFDRVLLMTYSEFGRTVAENGRRGTDHGNAGPMFVVGGRLKERLVGRHPSLSELDRGHLKFHTDFRSVYATLLDRWLGVDSIAVLGERFPPVERLL